MASPPPLPDCSTDVKKAIMWTQFALNLITSAYKMVPFDYAYFCDPDTYRYLRDNYNQELTSLNYHTPHVSTIVFVYNDTGKNWHRYSIWLQPKWLDDTKTVDTHAQYLLNFMKMPINISTTNQLKSIFTNKLPLEIDKIDLVDLYTKISSIKPQFNEQTAGAVRKTTTKSSPKPKVATTPKKRTPRVPRQQL